MDKKPIKKNIKKTVPTTKVQATKAQIHPTNYIILQRIVNISSILIFIASAFYYLLILNSNVLYKIQELSIFLPTKFYFTLHMKVPGGLLSWLGNFFTQFFYFPWLGSLIFVGLIALAQYLVVKVFRIPAKYFPITFIVSFALLLSFTQLGYLIYNIKAQGFIFSNLLGFISVLGALWLYRTVSSIPIRATFAVFFIAFCYPLIGFYALLSGLLFIISDSKEWFKTKAKIGWLPVLTLLVTLLVLPYIYYLGYYTQTEIGGIYLAGLPTVPFALAAIYAFWLPYLLLIVTFILCSILPLHKSKKVTLLFTEIFVAFCFLLVFYGFIKRSNKDKNFQTEIAMDRAVFENKWEDVIKLAKENKDEPTRIIVMKTRLALQRLNLAGDQLFTFPDGSKMIKTPVPTKLLILAGKQLFFQYGQTSFCYHWCVEDMVENGLKVDYLRYMVKCSLIKGELQLAQKYNDMLKLTLFHKAWADEYQKYIDKPQLMINNTEFMAIRPLTAFRNKLDDNYGSLEQDLLSDLSNSECATPEMLEYSLQSAILFKNSELFWPRYFTYIQTHQRVPRYYQEAALFFSYFERKHDLSGQKFDPQIVEHFKQLLKTCDLNVGKSKEENKQTFALLFQDTYWYYYFFSTPNFEM